MKNKKTILHISMNSQTDVEFRKKLESLGYDLVSAESESHAKDVINADSSISLILADSSVRNSSEAANSLQNLISNKKLTVICIAESESDIDPGNSLCNYGTIIKTSSLFEINQVISLVFNLNIAEFKAAEIEKSLTTLLDELPDLVWAKDTNGKYVYCNHRFEDFFGSKKAQIVGKTDYDFVDKKTADLFINNDKLAIDSGKSSVNEEAITFASDGHVEYCETIKKPLYDANKKIYGVLGIARDITARRNMESDLKESQRLKAIGTLASGIAHEINNPINGIMNYGQLILDDSECKEEIKKYAEEIIDETNRVSTIVKNLLRFSREEVGIYSSVQIEEIIEKTLSLIKTIIKRDQIKLEVNIENNLPKVVCRSQQIQQVLMNLLTNARDALNEKYEGYDDNKKIVISCTKITRSGKDFVRTSVQDFGNGIPPEIEDNIFLPFFTTKRDTQGTGLGLSVSHSIIKEHNGNIYHTTKEGEFAKFCIDLPAQDFIDS